MTNDHILNLHQVITQFIKFLITLVSACAFTPEAPTQIVYPEDN